MKKGPHDLIQNRQKVIPEPTTVNQYSKCLYFQTKFTRTNYILPEAAPNLGRKAVEIAIGHQRYGDQIEASENIVWSAQPNL
jgi:hypothetical protein